LVSDYLFTFQNLGWWLKAQLELGSWCFFQFSKSWFVAASSVEAWYLIIFSIFKILVGG
jgi:hypothetical protein